MNGRYVSEWVGATPDSAIPPRVRVRLWAAAGGHCESCTRKIAAGEKWDVDHIVALVNGGRHAEGNLQILCSWCHAGKSRADVAEKAIVYRKRAKHLGIKPRSSRPLPGSKASGWRKPFNRPPERRT